MTSVLMVFGSTPGRRQNAAVSVSQISCTTSVSRLAMASNISFRFGSVTAGFWPMTHSTFSFLWNASSNIASVP